MELIKSLKFFKKVEAEEGISKEQTMQGLQEAVDEVSLIKVGKKRHNL